MSASALRYVPAPDRNVHLRARIIALAHRHRRYGAGMIRLKLRQAGEPVNAKRGHRLYVEERLQIRRRRRKKVPVADRQPLVKPTAPNDVWFADFVFDRTAEGRVLQCLAIVDDATTEAVALIPARALGGLAVTGVLDRLAATRGLPRGLRTDNGLEFCGRAMLTWAHERRVTLRLIERASREAKMTLTEVRDFRVELLDAVHEMASEPVPDLESVRAPVEGFTRRLEEEIGEAEAGK